MSDTSSTHSDSTLKGVLSEKVKSLEHLVNVYLAKDDEPGVLSPRDVIALHAKAVQALKDLRDELKSRDLIYAS